MCNTSLFQTVFFCLFRAKQARDQMQFRNETTSTDHDKSIFPRMRQNPLHGCSESAWLWTESERVGSFYVLTFSSKDQLEDGHKKGKYRFFFSFLEFWSQTSIWWVAQIHKVHYRASDISGRKKTIVRKIAFHTCTGTANAAQTGGELMLINWTYKETYCKCW